ARGLGARPQGMHVLGDIPKMQEIAEGADDGERLLGREASQQQIELLFGFSVALSARRDGKAADRLDALKGLDAFMLANGLAEQASEQAHVLLQPVAFWRLGLVRRRRRFGVWGGAGFDLHVRSRSLDQA